MKEEEKILSVRQVEILRASHYKRGRRVRGALSKEKKEGGREKDAIRRSSKGAERLYAIGVRKR